ncbi:MAG TPA: hypothetical protein PL110_16075, partial [Candidatus Eremiobacteraeota bacterium]|nr:hypothetical protein [Candidatus Eremiobacteraeota bacterium]
MKRPGKNSIYERGIALITVLAISFILLGILIILMAEAYNHMGRALKYNSDARALTIAEYGVQKAIYELEEDLTWAGVTDKPFSRGSYTVIVVNNFTNPDPKGTVPANSIWVKSTGEFANGKFKKTVEVILSYQLIPYAAISDGRLEMRGTNPLTFKLKAIPGFTGKIHSNYNSASLKYDPSYPNFFDMLNVKTLDIDGTTFSSSGTISAACGTDINTAGGTVITSSSLDKSIPPLTYSDVKPAKGLTRLDQYAPPGVTFAGKIRKSAGGDLEALCSTPLGKVWFSVTAPFLPDGMSWNRATSTLKVSGNLKYYNDEDFEIENINLEVDEN